MRVLRVFPMLSCAWIQIRDSFLIVSFSNFTCATYVMIETLLSLYYTIICTANQLLPSIDSTILSFKFIYVCKLTTTNKYDLFLSH